jgi:CubicO group peptidase (beta-lactamase class C family)
MKSKAFAPILLAAGVAFTPIFDLRAQETQSNQQAQQTGRQSQQTQSELQGFSQERLDRIGAVMREEIEKGTMPGAVTLIARDGKIVHLEPHGYLDAAKTQPMTEDAVFRAFSMTKPLVSVATMMLAEQGKLSLRDPITNWLPELKHMKVLVETEDDSGNKTHEEIPAERPITVHDLLRHTSGFGYSNNVPPPIKEAYEQADIEARETDVSPEEFISRLAEIPLVYQPGTRWHYGLSTDVLGVLLERAMEKQLDVLLKEMIFDPLGMKDTSFQASAEQLPRLADALDSDPQRDRQWQWARVEEDPGKRYRLGGAGTITTAEDYFRFAQMMLNKGELEGVRLLAPKTVDLMLSDHIVGLEGDPFPTTGPGYGFGLGFGVRKHEGMSWVPGSVGDAMWAGAGGTSFTIDPQEEIVGVFMAAAPTPRLHTRFLFKNLMYGALADQQQ